MKDIRKNIRKIIFVSGMLLALMMPNSCVRNEDIAITEPDRYADESVKSYADLFTLFWNTMDERYNYFYEQKRKDGMNWDAIYKEYYPKFAALKSFNRTGFSDPQVQEDADKAIEYFTNIIDPIMDRHFSIKIKLPYSATTSVFTSVPFWGGMKTERTNIYEFYAKANYMRMKLAEGSVDRNAESFDGGLFTLLAGKLKTNPDIHYITFTQFSLSSMMVINLADKYLEPVSDSKAVLTAAEIEKSPQLNAITDVNLRNELKAFCIEMLKSYNDFMDSDKIKVFNSYIKDFKENEIVSENFIGTANELLDNMSNLPYYRAHYIYPGVGVNSQVLPFVFWFTDRMDAHTGARNYMAFTQALNIVSGAGPFYNKFLNPLHKGEVKKIIIDVRGNPGGSVMDARFFIDRFITQKTIFAYQRTKEGNGRFNYTPWIPAETNPHKFSMPANIPIVILTDKGSASMSEMLTMMLKSQGNQVISIGDYSAGATAGLAGPDEFNGGIISNVTSYLNFYMPLMALKDRNNEIVEGVGVKPEVYVAPPTDEEIEEMKRSPQTFVDRVITEAVKYLSSK
ncbi:peptidase S41 [Elizabethkingia meningoseptica]|uniref:S41 family peptidase n=1 Tax=Elizabethkingia meningoseptica TaxID=238 RepID=UPI0022F170B7|nr:S41 family peptidase [Elizabethkingia meningoseptica]EJK5328856.1 peptidase S41 [Elizabethkingia meningoseptica]MDE5437752.1 peptidase S41 [Elizabethkingia meningoseptica]MDE5467630.1 peptidase S41 [Elizabethkingia meningoseptica]MDE5474549.1 peptidase S41 [Elizabethkingia meningoseptica]MDE5477982.1 peptidase S41 [Elizabethkingia meningoseptica]